MNDGREPFFADQQELDALDTALSRVAKGLVEILGGLTDLHQMVHERAVRSRQISVAGALSCLRNLGHEAIPGAHKRDTAGYRMFCRKQKQIPDDSAVQELYGLLAATPTSVLKFGSRVRNHFQRERVETLLDLVVKSENELFEIRTFGATCMKEVRDKLSALSLRLAED